MEVLSQWPQKNWSDEVILWLFLIFSIFSVKIESIVDVSTFETKHKRSLFSGMSKLIVDFFWDEITFPICSSVLIFKVIFTIHRMRRSSKEKREKMKGWVTLISSTVTPWSFYNTKTQDCGCPTLHLKLRKGESAEWKRKR